MDILKKHTKISYIVALKGLLYKNVWYIFLTYKKVTLEAIKIVLIIQYQSIKDNCNYYLFM